MSNQQKLVIVVLVIIGLLYFVGLGAGFGFNDSTQGEPGSSSSSDPPDLVKLLDEWLAPFGAKVHTNGLLCANQPVTQPFWLKPESSSSTCDFVLPPASTWEKSAKARIRIVEGPRIPAYHAYKKPDRRPGRPDDPCRQLPARGPMLTVVVTEVGLPISTECWSETKAGEPITVIVLQRAVALKLELACVDCPSGGQPVKLRFE